MPTTPQFIRLLVLLIVSSVLTACAYQVHQPSSSVAQELIETHQHKLKNIQTWSLKGRIAFFDLSDSKNKQAVSFIWTQEPQKTSIQLYHALKGTLAQITVQPHLAQLIDQDGQLYTAHSLDALVQQHIGFAFPFDLVKAAILGVLPQQGVKDTHYNNTGTLHSFHWYDSSFAQHPWQVQIHQYRTALTKQGPIALPNAMQADNPAYRVKVSVSQWEVTTHE